MKKIFALLLALSMVFVLAACGGSETAAGTWNAKLNLAEIAGEEMGDMADLFKDVNVDVVLDMKSDNTFTLTMDAASAMSALKDAVRAMVPQLLEQYNMTEDDLAAAGMSVDDLIDQVAGEMDISELTQTISGTYKDEKGSLTFTPSEGTSFKGTWSGKTLTVDEDSIKIEFTRK